MKFSFGRAFAQLAMAILYAYCGREDVPDFWTVAHSHQVEAWLLSPEYKQERVKEVKR